MTAPTIMVDGQVIPGPFRRDDPLHLWIEAHWDKGLPWTHRADGTTEDVPQPKDAPQVLFEDSREATGSRYNVLFRAGNGLTPHQKTAIGALPVDDPYLEPYFNGGRDIYLYGVNRGDLQHVLETLVEALSWTAPIPYPDDIPFFDIEDAPVFEAWAVAIINGVHPTKPNRYRADSSRLVMACTFAMVRAGMTNLEVASILLNKDYKISDHIYRQNNPRRAVRRALDRARNQI